MRSTTTSIIASFAFLLLGCHLDEHYGEFEKDPTEEFVVGEEAEQRAQAAAAEEGHGPLERQLRGHEAERQAEIQHAATRDEVRAEAQAEARRAARAEARTGDVYEP